MQNPREEAVWRDFVWAPDLSGHYKKVSRIEDLTLFFEAIHFVILGKIDGLICFKAMLSFDAASGKIVRERDLKNQAKIGARRKRRSIPIDNLP